MIPDTPVSRRSRRIADNKASLPRLLIPHVKLEPQEESDTNLSSIPAAEEEDSPTLPAKRETPSEFSLSSLDEEHWPALFPSPPQHHSEGEEKEMLVDNISEAFDLDDRQSPEGAEDEQQRSPYGLGYDLFPLPVIPLSLNMPPEKQCIKGPVLL